MPLPHSLLSERSLRYISQWNARALSSSVTRPAWRSRPGPGRVPDVRLTAPGTGETPGALRVGPVCWSPHCLGTPRTGCLLMMETRLKALMVRATQITADVSSSDRTRRAVA